MKGRPDGNTYDIRPYKHKPTSNSAETLGEVIGGRFAPCLLEPEPDYPRGIVAVLAAVSAV